MSNGYSKTPDVISVKVFDEKEVTRFLSAETWNNYEGTIDSLDDDNRILQKNMEQILKLPEGKVDELMQSLRLRMIGQEVGINGAVTAEDQLPTKSVRILDPKTKRAVSRTIVDFDNEKIVKFAGLHQLDYLIYNLYFVLQRYWNVKSHPLSLEELHLDPAKLALILEEEIQIILNAYHIRRNCEEMVKCRDTTQAKEHKLKYHFMDFIQQITYRNNFRYCLPCGSAEHAVYITLLYFRKTNEIIIRIDNSSMEKTTILGKVFIQREKSDQANISLNVSIKEGTTVLVRYLANAMLQLNERNNDTARREIYNQNQPPSYAFCSSPNGYIELPRQKAPNCVVEGFRRGMWYRLWQRCGTKDDIIYKWLTMKFAALPHTVIQDIFLRERESADTIDAEKFEQRKNAILFNSSSDAKDEKTKLKKRSNFLDYARDTHFKVARLVELKKKLADAPSTNLLVCAITGITGCGKTELSKVYLREYLQEHPYAFGWYLGPDPVPHPMNPKAAVSYEQSYSTLLENFGISIKKYQAKSPKDRHESSLSAVWQKISEYETCVVVFDNAQSFLDIQDYIPLTSTIKGAILVTTNNQEFLVQGLLFSLNDGLDTDEAVKLLTELSGIEKDQQGAKDLTETLDYLPLAIRVCAGYIRMTKKTSFADYTRELKARPQFIEQRLSEDELACLLTQTTRDKERTSTLHRAVELLLCEMKISKPLFFKMLQYCAYMDNENIPEKVLTLLYLDLIKSHNSMWNRILNKMLQIVKCPRRSRSEVIQPDLQGMINKSHSLLTGVSDYYLHRTTQLVIRRLTNNPLKIIENVVSAVLELYPPDTYSMEKLQASQKMESHFLALTQHISLDPNRAQTLISLQLRLLLVLGRLAYHFSRYFSAMRYLESARQIAETVPNAKEIKTEILRYLGLSKFFVGEYIEAKKHLRQALRIGYEIYGSTDWHMAQIHNELCDILFYDPDTAKKKALRVAKRARKISQMIRPPSWESELQLAYSYHSIGTCLRDLRNFLAGTEYLKQSLELYIRLLGDWHPWTAYVYRDLGCLGLWPKDEEEQFVDMGVNISTSFEYINKYRSINIMSYGHDSYDVANAYYWRGRLRYVNKDLRLGLDDVNQAIKIFIQIVGLSEDLIVCYYWKGRILQRLNCDVAAQNAYLESLNVGGKHPTKQISWIKKSKKELDEIKARTNQLIFTCSF
jgi:tetratricopeptide (TPR) repeat protein